MGNYRTGRMLTYKPRYSQWEAFDLCHPRVREALSLAVTSYDNVAVLNYSRKHGADAAIRWIEQGNRSEAKRDWIRARGVKGKKGYVPAMPNPCVTLKLKPL